MIISDWTDGRIELLRALFPTGQSSATMAREINAKTGSEFSRNAVIGKMGRIGLTRPKKDVTARPRKPRVRKPHGFAVHNGDWRGGPSLPSSPVPPPVVFTTEHKCGFFALGNTSCRWPLWEGDEPHDARFYCGTPEADFDGGQPWCDGHSFVAHQGSPVLRQAAE